jgi:hypothetical protein
VRTLTVPRRFNGPPHSGNGGWAAGALAAASGLQPPVSVRLQVPPPLGLDLAVVDVHGAVELQVGMEVVAVATHMAAQAWTDWSELSDVTIEEARAAQDEYAGRRSHPFPTCFSCGPDREEGDGLRIFPGPVGEGRVAATWTPHPSVAELDGTVGVPVTWAALDCVGGWSSDLEHRPLVLAQMTARVESPPQAGTPYVAHGLLREVDGRKTWTASALFDADGRLVAQAEQLWIAVDAAVVARLQSG